MLFMCSWWHDGDVSMSLTMFPSLFVLQLAITWQWALIADNTFYQPPTIVSQLTHKKYANSESAFYSEYKGSSSIMKIISIKHLTNCTTFTLHICKHNISVPQSCLRDIVQYNPDKMPKLCIQKQKMGRAVMNIKGLKLWFWPAPVSASLCQDPASPGLWLVNGHQPRPLIGRQAHWSHPW